MNILWSTFATHQVMRNYLKMNFEDHPSKYTRYLVANASVAKVDRAIKSVEMLTTLMATLEKKLDTADKKATTASSKADEALRAAKRSKKEE